MVQNIRTNVIKKKRIVYHLVCELKQCDVRNFAKYLRRIEVVSGRMAVETWQHCTYIWCICI